MIKNISKDKILANESYASDSLLFKFRGLMFTKKIIDKGLVFIFRKEMKQQLHMFFVFYPIDIIFLDKDKKIIEMKKNFLPFTIYNQKTPSKYIIELPKDVISRTKTSLGDIIEF